MSPTFSTATEDHKLPVQRLTNGKDYVGWSYQLKSWFFEESLWQYVNGYVEQMDEPDYDTVARADAKKYFEWMASNSKAKNMMLKCLDPKYRVLIQDKYSCKEAWETLQTHFMNDSMIIKQQLEDEFDDYKLNYSLTMEENIMEFNKLISRLQYINVTHSQQKLCHKLMQALPKSYSNLKNIIKFTATKTNPVTLEELIERIEDHARDRKHWEQPIRKSEDINMVQKHNSNNQNSSKNNQKSSKKLQNIKNSNNQSENSKKNTIVKCTLCEGIHQWHKCPYKEEILKKGKEIRTNKESNQNNVNNVEETKQPDDVYSLCVSTNNKDFNNIVIDSGCTTVLSNNKNLFKNLKTITPVHLKSF